MRKALYVAFVPLLLAGCGDEPRPAARPVAPASPVVATTTPDAGLANSCAPAPLRFISATGQPTVRVKDCGKDEFDYLPESATAQIQRFQAQCQAKCNGGAPIASPAPRRR